MRHPVRGGVYRRADVTHPVNVCVVSNDMLHSISPYAIVVPVLPLADELHAVQGIIHEPLDGFLSPNFITWLPQSALGDYLGAVPPDDLAYAVRTVIATIS